MKIPYGLHYIDKNDIKNVTKALNRDLITQGPIVKEFEKKICNVLNVKYAVAVSSCTAGLHLSLQAISKNKMRNRVLTSPISFVSTTNMMIQNKLKPEFIDIDPNTLNICSTKLKKKIIKNNDILAIVPVHLGGFAASNLDILKKCKKKNIKIVEDAAHSFGAKYADGSMVGSCKYSDISIFSFHPVKTITTGEGGVVTTNSKEIYENILKLRSHGIEKNKKNWKNKKLAFTKNKPNTWYYEMQDLGFNYRLTDFQCALGLSQIKKLNFILKYREKLAKKYDEEFSRLKNLFIPQLNKRKLSSNHLYVLNINFKKLKISRNDFMLYLLKKGIITQVHYIPIPLHPYYKKKFSMKNLTNAMKYYNEAISIPIHCKLTPKSQKKIIFTIKKILS